MAEANSDQLTAEQLTEEVGKVLSSWPLYRRFRYKGKGGHTGRLTGMMHETISSFGMLPQRLPLHCSGCRHVTQWETDDCKVFLGSREFRQQKYTCRNCGVYSRTYFLLWFETPEGGVMLKVGQL